MFILYVLAPGTTPTTAQRSRADDFAAYLTVGTASGVTVGDGTQSTTIPVTAHPSVVVGSFYSTSTIIADTAGQATLTAVNAAKASAVAADEAVSSNMVTLRTHAKTAVTNNIAWLTAASNVTFPLTATEQKSLVNHVEALTRQVDVLIKLTLDIVQTLTGT